MIARHDSVRAGGTRGKGTLRHRRRFLISFSDPLNKAKAASKTEKALEGDAPRAQTMAASMSSGSFDLGITAMSPLVRHRG